MTFSSAVTKRTVFGDRKVVWGSYTNATADMGGDIATGLVCVEQFFLQRGGTAATALIASTVNEVLPLASGTVTIVTAPYEPGYWMAVGY